MAIQTIDAAEYARLAPMVQANSDWGREPIRTPATAKPFPEIGNEETGKVEQYRILNTPPESLVAYIGSGRRDGMGVEKVAGQTFPVTVWTGDVLGFATRGHAFYVRGTKLHTYYARIAGREYYGRGQGEHMSIWLKQTAASKRKAALADSMAGKMVARVKGLSAFNHTEEEKAAIVRGRRNAYGVRLTFADGSAAIVRRSADIYGNLAELVA